jgi:hypothetical protein
MFAVGIVKNGHSFHVAQLPVANQHNGPRRQHQRLARALSPGVWLRMDRLERRPLFDRSRIITFRIEPYFTAGYK